MAVSTLLPRFKPHRKPAGNGVPVYRQPPSKPTPARLHEVEESLLAHAIERHPGRERAITHLLSDIERPAGLNEPARRSLLGGSTSSLERIEDLLFEAVVRTHPNRGLAIDRLLGDVVGDAADIDDGDALVDASIAEEGTLSELRVDNDFDGMS